MKKKVILIIVIVGILISDVLWASALIKCEILTKNIMMILNKRIHKIQCLEKWNISKY